MNYKKEFDRMAAEVVAGADASLSLKDIFGNVSDDFWYWLFTDGYDRNPVLRKVLPSMPDPQIQTNFTGRSGHMALSQAFEAYKLFKSIYSRYAMSLSGNESVLDFGCGWGRIIRFFLKDIEPTRLWGIDCYKEMIELCKTQNLRCNFDAIDPMPPTRFPDASFDLIYLYSVFSHLSEEAHLKWLQEFSRLLKPSGIVIATTRPRDFIRHCIELSSRKDLEPWQYGAAISFRNPEQALRDYDDGKFVHSATGGGGVLEPSFYGESCIPEKYVKDVWTSFFPTVGYVEASDHLGFDQDVIFAVKS